MRDPFAELHGQDAYELLGVPGDASTEAIQRAFRKQIVQWHPDQHMGSRAEAEAERRTRLLTVARDILVNRREEYDSRRAGTPDAGADRGEPEEGNADAAEPWRSADGGPGLGRPPRDPGSPFRPRNAPPTMGRRVRHEREKRQREREGDQRRPPLLLMFLALIFGGPGPGKPRRDPGSPSRPTNAPHSMGWRVRDEQNRRQEERQRKRELNRRRGPVLLMFLFLLFSTSAIATRINAAHDSGDDKLVRATAAIPAEFAGSWNGFVEYPDGSRTAEMRLTLLAGRRDGKNRYPSHGCESRIVPVAYADGMLTAFEEVRSGRDCNDGDIRIRRVKDKLRVAFLNGMTGAWDITADLTKVN